MNPREGESMAFPTAKLVSDWQAQFRGKLLTPGMDEWEAARRIWNGMIDRRPALIAQCVSSGDVQAAVKLAAREGMDLSIRGGGHGVAGNAVCDGGLMIDLSPMKTIRVDPALREATASPGVLWGEFDQATQAHGLATTGGQVSHTGIAGLTLGGGLGYLMGKFGAVCDNLLSADIVTADGELLTANPEQNADLFWAVRGAGANFGVVTEFRYRLHPLSEVLAGMLLHPRDRAAELIDFCTESLKDSPDESYTTIGFLNSPDGAPLVGIIPVYAGAVDEGERLLAPLRKFGPPVADLVQTMPYPMVQRMLDDAVPIGDRYYWKSNFVDDLSPALVKVLIDGAAAMPSPYSLILLFEIKGQVRRVPKEAMAFEHRDANFELSIVARWTDPAADSANIRWARDVWTAAQPYVSSAVYANHMTGEEGPERIRAAYGGNKYEKLAALKAKFDPANLFRLNHNILPR
jgi:FAD/FMN-containing dehydrogenase